MIPTKSYTSPPPRCNKTLSMLRYIAKIKPDPVVVFARSPQDFEEWKAIVARLEWTHVEIVKTY